MFTKILSFYPQRSLTVVGTEEILNLETNETRTVRGSDYSPAIEL